MQPLLKFVTLFLRCTPAFFRIRNEQALVELALRQQLATYALKGPKPRITSVDRTFWVFLSRFWSGWKENLVIVQPDTVIRWHRKGFRLYWRSISKRGPGRPPIPAEVQTHIRRFANENGWRARKVRTQLAKLGISVGSATVSRYLPKRIPDYDQRQRWKTFLRNHKNGIAAMDFIVLGRVSAYADSTAVGGVQRELVSAVSSLFRRENTGNISSMRLSSANQVRDSRAFPHL